MTQPTPTPPPMPDFPPPAPPKRNRTNAIIIGSAVAAIAAIITTGVIVANNQNDTSSPDNDKPKPTASAAAAGEPSKSSTVSPECRAWIESELKDDSDGIDAVSGQAVCGDLSEDELNAAIEQVADEISSDPTALEDAASTQAEKFQKCVADKGTASEQAAVKHVIKVTGADESNGIADTAEVFTDYSGGMFGPYQGEGKLIASAFASCYSSKNGLVTVYDKDGELLSNGNY